MDQKGWRTGGSRAFPAIVAALLGLLGGVLAMSAGAQPRDAVLIAPRFTPGESMVYTVEAEFTRRRSTADDAPGTRLVQSADVTIETLVAEPDGGAAARLTFERLKTSVQTLGPDPRATSWEWRRAGGEPVTDGDPIAGLEEASLALARSAIRVRLAPDGTLRSVEGLEEAYDALRERPPGDPTPILGVFSPGASVSFLEGFWSFSPGRGRAPRLSPGESWRVVKSAPLFSGYEAEAATTYTLDRIAGDNAEISGRTEFAIRPPAAQPDPADPAPRIIEQSGKVEAVWDTAARRVVRRRSERSLAWSATIALTDPIEVKDITSSRVEIRLQPR